MDIDVEGIEGEYDSRGLSRCRCGKHWYPSKKMFKDFLDQYPDVDAVGEIWSRENWSTGEVTIYVELKYKVADVKEAPKE